MSFPLLPHEEILRRSEVIKFLGRGCYGAAHKILFDGSEACLKEAPFRPDDFVDDFQKEAKLLWQIGGAGGCPKLLACGTDYPCIVMSYAQGETLDGLVSKGELSTKQWLQIFLSMVHNLRQLHKTGHSHNDIHDENVIISPSDLTAQLIDVGLATPYTKPRFGRLTRFINRFLNKFKAKARYPQVRDGPLRDVYMVGVMLKKIMNRLKDSNTHHDWDTRFLTTVDKMVDYDALKRPTLKHIEQQLQKLC